MKARRFELVVALVVVGLLAAAPVGASSHSSPPLASLRRMLIDRADLPAGWLHGVLSKPLATSCTPVLSRQHLLGTNSVEVDFYDRPQQSLAFEYLAYRKDVVDAFQRADTFIYTFGSCGESQSGVVTDSAVNDGAIETRTFGAWSDTDRYSYDNHGAKYEFGYMVVRDSDYLLIVGFGNRGVLDLTTMEGLTTKALANLPAS